MRLAEVCQSLQSVSFERCNGLTRVAENGDSLRSVNFAYCRELTDGAVMHLAGSA